MQELKRCVKELGFPGVEIGSHINNWNLDAPELQSLFAVSKTFYNNNDCSALGDHRRQRNLVLAFLFTHGTWSKAAECQSFGCHGW